jgi:superfamily II DNA or RNA helicase
MDPAALPERRRSLARALRPQVDARTREKGYTYFATGRVGPLAIRDDTVAAAVRGTRTYPVTLARRGGSYVAGCACPAFFDRQQPCKHVWALVLAADRDRALPPDSEAPALLLDYPFSGDPLDAIAGVVIPAPTTVPIQVPPAPEPWQQMLSAVRQRAASAVPATRYVNGEFMYVIDKTATTRGGGVAVNILWRQQKRNGEWGKPQPASLMASELPQLPDPVDREVLATLHGANDAAAYGYPVSRSSFHIAGPITDRALALLASSRRLYLRDNPAAPDQLRPIAWDAGAPWQFRLELTTAADGSRVLAGTLTRDADRMEAAAPALVLESGHLIARGSLSRLDHGGAFAWLAELRRAGPARIPAEGIPALVEAIVISGVDPARLPPDLRYEVVQGCPRPMVRVTRPRYAFGYGAMDTLSASPSFDYGGVTAPAGAPGHAYDASRNRVITRDLAAEQSALQRLQQLGFRKGAFHAAPDEYTVLASQFARAVRHLVAEGWHVEADGAAFRAASAMRIQVRSGIDWFELHGNVDFGEGRIVPLTELLAAARQGETTIVLDDGSRGIVPEEWLRRFARIAGFGDREGDVVRFKPSQAALLDALLESQPLVDVDEAFRRAREALRSFGGITAPAPPPAFQGVLREYQLDALGWFEFLRRFGFGGCLADDMGLGKTVMVLALLESRRHEPEGERRPSVVVVPRSLVFNWMAEARRFVPALRVLDYTGPEREHARIADHDLVLTTYGTLRRDITMLKEQAFDYVILDEAQAVKNAATASAKAVRLLHGRHRLALSGTPVENHIGELWSLFDFLNPGLLGSSSAFTRASSLQLRDGGEDLALVSRALKPLILRRTKAQVAPELPSRTEQTIYCELEGAPRRFYDDLRASYRASLLARVERDGLARSKMHVLEALLRLRQAACHPGLVDPRRLHQPSAKFDALLPQLREVIDEGHKALVFSQFTEFLGLLRERLDREKIAYEYLDGRTRDRAARVERFSTDPGCRLFLISLKAGGLGLNLTAAEYVFLLDPWWNPAAEAQAIDRAHRIGQSRHVFAYRLIAKDTVEEKVAELQASKRDLADAILTADPALIRNLRREDLELLLS